MNAPETIGDVLLAMEGVTIGSFHPPQIPVMEHVDWQVRRGEFWVVAGHHGSGKSDLLMTAAGLMGPRRGTCTLFGQAMPGFEHDALAARLKTGLVFHDARLLNHLSLGGNVRLPLCYHRGMNEAEAAEHTRRLIEALGLARMADCAPGTVGRPWHLRAALARALVMGPDLLLLDEPLAGLDTRHAAWWIEFLRNLHRGDVCLPAHASGRESAPPAAATEHREVTSAVTATPAADDDSALRVSHSAVPRGVTVVVASGTLDAWCDVATHCAVLEGGRLHVRGPLRQAMQRGDAHLREFAGLTRPVFDPPPPI